MKSEINLGGLVIPIIKPKKGVDYFTNEEISEIINNIRENTEVIVDSDLSSSSTNPVQNKVVKEALDGKVDKVVGKGLSTEDFTTAEKTKLDNIEAEAQVNLIETIKVNGTALNVTNKTVDVMVPTADSINTLIDTALEDYDTSDEADEKLEDYTTTDDLISLLDGKVDKVAGKGLSTEDFTTEEKIKLASLGTSSGTPSNAEITIDNALSSSSTNPVQNKVIKEALDGKVDKVVGKGLSTEDFTTEEKEKLAGLNVAGGKSYYGICNTDADEQVKIVNCPEFVLEKGARISVLFYNTNTFINDPDEMDFLQLNVNNTGAIDISNSSELGSFRLWDRDETVQFIYTGSSWHINKQPASTDSYGDVKLEISPNSGSEYGKALAPLALNLALQYMLTGAPLYYDYDETYSVGNIVRHDVDVYECISAINEPEEWNDHHWLPVATLQDQIYNLIYKLIGVNGRYSPYYTYDVGDRVRLGTNIYECTTQISTPEVWNSNHWQVVPDDKYRIDNKIDKSSFVYDSTTETLSITI